MISSSQRKGLFFTAIIAITLSLTGCFNMATSGAEAIYNRRTIQKKLSDQNISREIYQALYMKSNEFKNTNVSITTHNHEVLLAGQVLREVQKEKAEELAKQIPQVASVYNLIRVESPSSTLTRISDSWITAKVKAKLLASNDIDASDVKVVTENGTVYLMGILLPEEANTAVDLARTTDGVQSVVKIFSYVKISKEYPAFAEPRDNA